MKIKSFEESDFSEVVLAESGLFFEFFEDKKMFVYDE